MVRSRFCLIVCSVLSLLCTAWLFAASAFAQEGTGTSFGLPNSSPAVLWPRLMGADVIRPDALYPNGSQFGLGTTAGGFGSSGTAALSGVGLERRSLGGLEAEEAANRYSYQRRLAEIFAAENLRSSGVFSAALSSRLSRQMGTSFSLPYAQAGIVPSALPGVDGVLQDLPAGTDSILKTDLR